MRRRLLFHLILVSSLLPGASVAAPSSTSGKSYTYVWLFTANSDSVADLADLYTADFDEALTQARCLPKVNRRGKDTIQLHREGEKDRRLDSADYLTPRERRLLTERDVESVVLGDISDDLEGGVIRVGVRLDALAGDDLGAASVTFPRGRRYDAEERKNQMVKLAKELCADLGHPVKDFDSQSPDSRREPLAHPKPSCAEPKDQFWGKIRFSLKGARLGGDILEIDFVVSNENPTDQRIVLFGGGPTFGNDPSRIFVDSMEYKATGVVFGSEAGEWIARNSIPSAAGLRATLSFRGVPRDMERIEILELNYNDGKTNRKQGTAQFRDVCLE